MKIAGMTDATCVVSVTMFVGRIRLATYLQAGVESVGSVENEQKRKEDKI